MMRMWIDAFLPPVPHPVRAGPKERRTGIVPQPQPCAQEACAAQAQRARQYEEALRHLAEHAFATRDWRFAQAILKGHSVEEAKALVQDGRTGSS